MRLKSLSTRQAAVIAHRHQRTIVNWIQKGDLKAMKMPGAKGPYEIQEKDLRETIRRKFTPRPYKPKKDHEPGSK